MNDIFIMADSVSNFPNFVYINLNVLNISLALWAILKNFLYKETLKFTLCITFREKCCPKSQGQLRYNSIMSYLLILLCKTVFDFCNFMLTVFIQLK